MVKSGTKKARKEEDKAARREGLLDAAAGLLGEHPYEAITMSAVAERAGFAKGTLYLYFDSKEDLFLGVIGALLGTWFADVDARLDRAASGITPDELLSLFAHSLVGRRQLLDLLAIVNGLEQALGVEAASHYKKSLWVRLTTTGAKLEAKVPGVAPGDGFRLLMHVWALLVGIHQLAHPAKAVKRVIDDYELHAFRFDFETELVFALGHLLRGITGAPRGPQARRS